VTKGTSVCLWCGVHNEKMVRSGWLSVCVLRNGTLGRGMCITRYEYSVGGVSVALAGFGSDCKTIEERDEISMGFIVDYGFFYGLWRDDMASPRVFGEKTVKTVIMGYTVTYGVKDGVRT
jgi:hypothetical protein